MNLYSKCAMVALFAIVGVALCSTSKAALLPFVEEDGDSDLAFNAAVSGTYTAGALDFSGTGSALDVGPGTVADFTGFGAQLTTTGIQVDASGNVTNPGVVTVTYLGPPDPPGSSLTAAYPGVNTGSVLLTGHVVEVLLEGAAGDDNLMIAFEATGGALFGDFTQLDSANVGLLVNAGSGGGLPSSFAADFSFGGSSTIDMIGPIIPEPTSLALVIAALGAFSSVNLRRN